MGLSGVSSNHYFTRLCWTRLWDSDPEAVDDIGDIEVPPLPQFSSQRHRSAIEMIMTLVTFHNFHKHTARMLDLSSNEGEIKTRGRSRLYSRSTLPLSLSLNPNYHPLALRVIIAPGFPENTPVSSRFYYLLFHFVISSSFTLEYC